MEKLPFFVFTLYRRYGIIGYKKRIKLHIWDGKRSSAGTLTERSKKD